MFESVTVECVLAIWFKVLNLFLVSWQSKRPLNYNDMVLPIPSASGSSNTEPAEAEGIGSTFLNEFPPKPGPTPVQEPA